MCTHRHTCTRTLTFPPFSFSPNPVGRSRLWPPATCRAVSGGVSAGGGPTLRSILDVTSSEDEASRTCKAPTPRGSGKPMAVATLLLVPPQMLFPKTSGTLESLSHFLVGLHARYASVRMLGATASPPWGSQPLPRDGGLCWSFLPEWRTRELPPLLCLEQCQAAKVLEQLRAGLGKCG